MADSKYNSIMQSLMGGMNSFLSTKTVVGEPIVVKDTIIVPMMDVSFGVGMGAGSNEKGDKGCGGVGGKMTPSAVLIISNGSTRLISVNNQDSISKILDMVPDLVNKFTVPAEDADPEKLSNEEAIEAAFDN